jgi:predicted PurR-regulated permease PerM
MDAQSPKSGDAQKPKPADERAPRGGGAPVVVGGAAPFTNMVGAWRNASQVAAVGIFIILFFAALDLARPIALPVVTAFVITMMLSLPAEQADAYRVPPLVTAIVLWLVVAAAFYAVITLVSAPVVDWIGKAPDIGRTVQEKLTLLERPLAALREIRNAVLPSQQDKGINLDLVAIARDAVAVVTPAVGEILIFFVTLFFMLLGRKPMRRALVALSHEHETRLRSLRILNDIERNLTGYLSVVTMINLGVGIGSGIIAAAVGLPSPVAWGVLGFVMNFVPYIGAAIMEIGMFLVGLVTFPGLTYAFLAPLLYVAMALFEGQFLTPSIVGRRFTLNPLTVFLSLVFWAWLWGPVGAFLAAPILVMALTAAGHLFPKHEPDLPG